MQNETLMAIMQRRSCRSFDPNRLPSDDIIWQMAEAGTWAPTSMGMQNPIIVVVTLVGGGVNPQPDEISLVHNGVLFLDELPEFKRSVLVVLRQPMEERRETISRTRMTTEYSASFMLVAAMNPCSCGYYNHPTIEFTCNPGAMNKYMAKISGPLMDRIDLHIEVTPIPHTALAEKKLDEFSAVVRRRVIAARHIQEACYRAYKGIHCNAQMNQKLFRQYCAIDEACQNLMKAAMDRLDLSAHAYDRILKVSRTIADLEAATNILASAPDDASATAALDAFESNPQNRYLPITVTHLSEAINYRSLDRDSWWGEKKDNWCPINI